MPVVFSLFLIVLLGSSAFATPTIKVVAPVSGGNVGNPIYFEAYAYNPSCKAGISAMRLYSAPGQPAATIYSNHIETFIGLNPGKYTTTLVAYDNCGGTTATNIPITVTATTGITTFLPSSTTAGAPVHVVASAKSYVCANDVKSMQVFTSPGVAPYSVFGNQVDAFLALAPGSYNIVIQANDHCGNVLKSSFPLTVTAVADRFLYSTGGQPADAEVILFPLNKGAVGATAGVVAATGAADGLTQIFADPAGYFLYATDGLSIYAYQIDRNDGSLFGVPGSPYKVGSGTRVQIALDPNGHFLYVSDPGAKTLTTYAINRSDGTLGSSVTTSGVPGGSLITNYTGVYLYDFSYSTTIGNDQIYAFSIDLNTGALAKVAGSPFTVPGTLWEVMPPATAWKYLYLTGTQKCPACFDETYAYTIAANGSLSLVAGSPFVSQNIQVLGTPVADWLTRYYWYPSQTQDSSQFFIETSGINASTGALGASAATSTGTDVYNLFVEDHSGRYLYGSGQTPTCNGQSCAAAFGSWTVGAKGKLVPLSGPVVSGYNTPPGAIANSR